MDWLSRMHQIEEHLYLGSYQGAVREGEQMLTENNIKVVLTVIESKIPEESKVDSIEYHWIEADDTPTQDLLTYFPQTNRLIDSCVKSERNILVHCMAGVSRSATVVIAYIMFKYNMPYIKAKDVVKARRGCIWPNNGFVQQLKLFEKMEFTLNANCRQLRQFLVEKYLLCDPMNEDLVKHFFERLSLAEELTKDLKPGQQYVCSKCDHKLFSRIHILENEEQTVGSDAKESCGRTYVEPQKWMSELIGHPFKVNERKFLRINCSECREQKAKCYPFFESTHCDCLRHKGINCLRIQMVDKAFKSDQKE